MQAPQQSGAGVALTSVRALAGLLAWGVVMDVDVGDTAIGLGHHQLSFKAALSLDLAVFDHREDVHGDLHVLPASPLPGAGLTAPLAGVNVFTLYGIW